MYIFRQKFYHNFLIVDVASQTIRFLLLSEIMKHLYWEAQQCLVLVPYHFFFILRESGNSPVKKALAIILTYTFSIIQIILVLCSVQN